MNSPNLTVAHMKPTYPRKRLHDYGKTVGKLWKIIISNGKTMIFNGKTMERSTIFNGKTHYFNGQFQ